MRSARARKARTRAVEDKAERCSISTAGTTAGTRVAKESMAHGAKEAKEKEKVGKVQAKEKATRSTSKERAITAVSGATAERIAGVHPQEEMAKEKVEKEKVRKVKAEKATKVGGARTAVRIITARRRWL